MAHPTHIPGSLSPRASFHSPLHCMLYINKIRCGLHQKIHHGLHRVAVGASGRSPAHPHGAPHPHSVVGVTAGELPLAPTLHVVHQRNTQKLHQQKCTTFTSPLHCMLYINKIRKNYIKNTPRVASRSCRGDWEVARPIRMARPTIYPQRG